ncbi:cell wall metabolism sensor histidine kinase WalK [Alkalilimnicola ehrlichii]|nr:ATP-binding protein [Alkalilimnicola ehrlichii]
MRSLFLKIFLWFWVAMLLMGGTLILAQRYWAGPSLPTPSAMAAYVAEAERMFAHKDSEGVRLWLRRLNRESELRFFVIEERSRLFPAQRLPRPLQERLEAELDTRQTRGGRPRAVAEAFKVDGREYHLVAMLPHHRYRLQDLPVSLRLGVALAVSAAISLLLAGVISRPIRRIRLAAQRLADGELEARVPPLRGRDEIAELGHDFNLMAERLQHLLEVQTQLLRDVSHELRSPLNRLQVALELARGAAGASAGTSLDRIEREAERLNDLIGQVLSLSRMETGAVEPRWAAVDISGLVRDVVDDAAFEAGDRLSLQFQGAEGISATADAGLLHSAVENVVRNAVQYSPEGGRVGVVLRTDGEAINITVLDDGPGLPEEQLERVFEPFVRVSAARERSTGGYGLGLAIARRALRIHGGDIEAANRPEGGLAVSLRLPRSRPSRDTSVDSP